VFVQEIMLILALSETQSNVKTGPILMEEVALHSKKTEIQTQCLQLAPLQNMYKNPIKQPFHVKKMLELKNSKSQQNSL